ncbi:MAG TPA: Yip1 family protein [Roseiflexaceae bacterium]|nr:Yip1 family protein [Roseiflexaceae bacterium]
MTIQGVPIREMIDQSMTVLTKPSVPSFEEYEKRGGLREGLTYVGVAAAIAGVVGLLGGLITGGVLGGIAALIGAVLSVVLGYLVFGFLIFFIGKQFGGTGSQDEVLYSTALYAAPIQAVVGVVNAIPLLNCLAAPAVLVLGIYQIYLGYLATRASMNLTQNNAIITLVLAFLAQVVIGVIVGVILGVIFGVGAAAGGAIQ